MMNRDEAREVKAQLADYVDELVQRQGLQPLDLDVAAASGPTLGLGLAPRDGGGYAMAVRYRLGVPAVRRLARKVVEQAGPAVDVRRTGRIRPVTTGHVADAESSERRAGQRLPVATALAEGETGRARPLRPGVSIAHVDVTAGTLGAFVVREGALHVLSNFHVLAGTPRAQIGDVIVQPGPADGGRAPRDRVGTLAATVPLERGRRATVDAALALLDEQEVDLRYPVGPITTTTVAFGNEEVAKIGRTTAVTTGRVTAIELDDVVVGYGNPLGNLRFDDQIEVESTGMGPFSRGGDSGSLVYRADGIALGLLFAGSETGGSNGAGLTYLNPIDAVLSALGVELAS
ncbi:chymotrypsin family serine protease [Cellulomonas timonensis]|uniref:hypothetical protein n=1 Tax=Cellulomonas timonensis TaxID=1689271 RepID=UPI000AD4F35C|nr:hypothetical protein [Cellulomonas timonensis]